MRRRYGELLLIFLYAFGTAIAPAAPLPPNSISAPPASPGWRSDFKAAEAEARRLGLPLVVHFYADWCIPCQHMEREVLHSPALLRQLQGRFVAVKVDSDRHPDLVQRFHVDSLPSDVFLGVDGTILARSSAYQDQQTYLARLSRVEARVAQSRKVQIAGSGTPKTPAASAPSRSEPAPLNAATSTAPKASEPQEPETKPATKPADDESVPVKRPSWSLGLRGYSPVALSKHRQWIRGDAKFAAEHKGIVYYMASTPELDEFRQAPERFAPQLLGCDPVILAETDRAVVGDTRYGVFYDGALYFFANLETRARFKAQPERYTRIKHVLNLKKIESTETR